MIGPVRAPSLARAWSLLTVGAVVLALGLQAVTSVGASDGSVHGPLYRGLNQLAYFTIQSSLLVALSAVLTGLQPGVDTVLRRVLRLTALVSVSVTGVVYHALLAGLVELSPVAAAADRLLHTVVPLLAVAGWLAFGPRGRTSWRVVGLSTVFPVLWLVVTLVRGRLVDGFWPYPFVDVDQTGWARVLVSCAVVAVLFVGLAASAHGVDRLLARTRPPAGTGQVG